MSVNSVILSFRTMFDAARAADLTAAIGLRFGEDEFLARISGGTLDVSRDDAGLGDAVVTCDQNALAAVVYGGVPLDQMIKAGEIEIAGKSSLIKRFCKLFPLPETAPELAV